MYFLDQLRNYNQKTTTIQLSSKSSELASSESDIKDSDSDKADQFKDDYKTTEIDVLLKLACKSLISENNNVVSNYDVQ